MREDLLLDHYFKKLRLPVCSRLWRKVAKDQASSNLSYEAFMVALLGEEVSQREENSFRLRVKKARFPYLKTLEDFDFDLVPSPKKQRLLELSRGSYIERAEPVIFLGNPGLGKTHLAIALGLEACRQGRSVRFFTAVDLAVTLWRIPQRRHKHEAPEAA